MYDFFLETWFSSLGLVAWKGYHVSLLKFTHFSVYRHLRRTSFSKRQISAEVRRKIHSIGNVSVAVNRYAENEPNALKVSNCFRKGVVEEPMQMTILPEEQIYLPVITR